MNRAELIREILAEAIILEGEANNIERDYGAASIGRRALMQPRADAAKALVDAVAAIRAIPSLPLDR